MAIFHQRWIYFCWFYFRRYDAKVIYEIGTSWARSGLVVLTKVPWSMGCWVKYWKWGHAQEIITTMVGWWSVCDFFHNLANLQCFKCHPVTFVGYINKHSRPLHPLHPLHLWSLCRSWLSKLWQSDTSKSRFRMYPYIALLTKLVPQNYYTSLYCSKVWNVKCGV